jgi:hypothetical protein
LRGRTYSSLRRTNTTSLLTVLNAWYLDAEHILARTRQGRLLVIDRDSIEVMHQLAIPGFGIFGYDESGKRVDDPPRVIDTLTDTLRRHSATVAGTFVRLLRTSGTGEEKQSRDQAGVEQPVSHNRRGQVARAQTQEREYHSAGEESREGEAHGRNDQPRTCEIGHR